ncbi:CLAVATA3/ESR (CLE)-related protein 13 [Striga hermonthica]|uniref:CLAVATA3/ESR (CLE)-related protein 13 n=1 Tax=Striga hermonthica TaxID=68872 RepID=A0A9N7NN56_STRHE|nr:CLAVATA3/ESR (CLE)-related protein 13 [Striga hermonthica]
MAMKIPSFFPPLLLFFLILMLFHDFHNFKFLQNTSKTNGPSSLGFRQPTVVHRRALAAAKFDLSSFVKHRHRKEKTGPPSGNEIDPRYGVEKRLVPSGPNPLHH